MRKFLIGLLIMVLGVSFNINEASAKTFNWEEFVKLFIDNWEDEENQTKFDYDKDSLDVTIKTDDIEHTMHIDYNVTTNTIKFTNTNNYENENELVKLSHYMYDETILIILETSIMDYYDLKFESYEEMTKVMMVGTTLVEGETLNYKDDTLDITSTKIESYEKNINKLENYINNNLQTTTTTTTTTKVPTTTATNTTTTTAINQTNTTTITQTTTIENPKTADVSNQLYVIVGIIALVGITSLGIKFAKANR